MTFSLLWYKSTKVPSCNTIRHITKYWNKVDINSIHKRLLSVLKKQ